MEVDFAVVVPVACMEYLASQGDDGPSLSLELWSAEAGAWIDPPLEATQPAGEERRAHIE